MSNSVPGEVRIHLAADDADADELDRLAENLHRELMQLDIGRVTRVAEPEAPQGTPAPEVIHLVALIVAVGKAAGALGSVTHAARGWVGGKPGRTVRMEIDGDVLELSSATAEQQQQLVDAWIARHSAEQDTAGD